MPVGNEHDWRSQFNNFLFYQWYKNGQPISGANASTLTLTNVLPSDNGSTIVAKMRALGYAGGSGNALWASSTPATLTVITPQPTIHFQVGGGGSSIVLSWGTNGHLESSPVLGSGAVWTPVGPNPYPSPATIPITTTNVSQFFRVVVP